MMDIREQLKQLRHVDSKISPSRDWVVSGRARLMSQISNNVTVDKINFDQMQRERAGLKYRLREAFFVVKAMPVVRVFKPAITALVVAVVAMSGWIASVSASFNSVPGDRLWAVKRAAQKTEIVVKSIVASQEEKAGLHLRLAKNRAEDIKKAVHKTVTDKSLTVAIKSNPKDVATAKEKQEKTEKDLTVAARDLTEAVKSASAVANEQVKNAAKDNAKEAKEAVALVKDVTKNNDEIVKTLKATVAEVGNSAPTVTREVIDTVKAVNNSTLSTVEAVVSPSTTLSGFEGAAVKSIVSDKLAEIAQTAKDIKQNVATIKDAITLEANASTVTASTTRLNASLGSLPLSATLTGSSTFKMSMPPVAVSATSGLGAEVFVSTTTATARDNASSTAALFDKMKQAEVKNVVIQESVNEIKKNIDAGNLQEAVNQLKGLNETTGTAEKLIIETQNQIADIGSRTPSTGSAPSGGYVK